MEFIIYGIVAILIFLGLWLSFYCFEKSFGDKLGTLPKYYEYGSIPATIIIVIVMVFLFIIMKVCEKIKKIYLRIKNGRTK